jgi:tRNA (guanine10-N2)-dimethyltransferase
MSHLYLLAGENLELAEAELKEFLKSQGEEQKVHREGRLAETAAEPDQLKRLALTHEISEKICETDQELEVDIECNGSFAVRAENLSGREVDASRIEEKLGSCISGGKVDLENPENVFRAYILEGKIVVGKQVLDIDRGLFDRRKNQNRPFSSPVSLDPVTARVLVNLSGVKPGEHLLDPFCGTGGILIEAGLCGVGVHGLDIKEEMKNGAEENLESCGIINHDVRQGKISDIDEVFGEEDFDAVVTDLPYGRSSKKTEDAVDDFLHFLEDFEGEAVFMYDEEELDEYSADFSVYIHKNLTRHIFVI